MLKSPVYSKSVEREILHLMMNELRAKKEVLKVINYLKREKNKKINKGDKMRDATNCGLYLSRSSLKQSKGWWRILKNYNVSIGEDKHAALKVKTVRAINSSYKIQTYNYSEENKTK